MVFIAAQEGGHSGQLCAVDLAVMVRVVLFEGQLSSLFGIDRGGKNLRWFLKLSWLPGATKLCTISVTLYTPASPMRKLITGSATVYPAGRSPFMLLLSVGCSAPAELGFPVFSAGFEFWSLFGLESSGVGTSPSVALGSLLFSSSSVTPEPGVDSNLSGVGPFLRYHKTTFVVNSSYQRHVLVGLDPSANRPRNRQPGDSTGELS